MQDMQVIAWNKRKIWKPKQYKITTTLPPRNILQLQLRSLILFMNTSWKQICTCKSHIKQVWNTETSPYHFITATPHYYRKTFCSNILVVHFTASTIW